MHALTDERQVFGSELADELEIAIQSLADHGPTNAILTVIHDFVDIAHSFLLEFHNVPIWQLNDGASIARVTCIEEDIRALATELRERSAYPSPGFLQ